MAIKQVAGGWQVDIQPGGRGKKRIRRTFKNKRTADAFEKEQMAQGLQPDYQPPTSDNRRLSEIGNAWYSYHGNTLTSGKKRLQQFHATARALGDPLARLFDPRLFLEYREARLSEINEKTGEPKVTRNHLNHELTYLKSAFSKLIEIGDWKAKNPVENVKPLPLKKRAPFFLTLNQVNDLLIEMAESRNTDLITIARICLSTGCRWGEAQYLEAENIHHGKIHFQETKNGRSRSVPIKQELEQEILRGRNHKGPLFTSAWEAFNLAIKRSHIALPKGTATHVLRHTFASHFMMDGGDLLQLNKILGHETIEMTMKYAHLAPQHLESATRHNVLDRLDREKASKRALTLG